MLALLFFGILSLFVGRCTVPYLVELQIADTSTAGTESHAWHKIAFIGDFGYNSVWYNISDRDPTKNDFIRAQKYSITIQVSITDHSNIGTLRGVRLIGEDPNGYIIDCMLSLVFVCARVRVHVCILCPLPLCFFFNCVFACKTNCTILKQTQKKEK